VYTRLFGYLGTAAFILTLSGCAEPAVKLCEGGCPDGQICDIETNRCIEWRPPECPKDMGRYMSLAVDSEDQVVFSTYTRRYGDLIVGRVLSDGSMDCEYVDGITATRDDDVGLYSSLALDMFDRPHVAYFDRTNGKLKYAKKSGEEWTIVTIPHATAEDDIRGRASSLAIDSEMLPHIAYWDETSGDLELVKKVPEGRWAVERIPLENRREDWPKTFGGEVGRIVALVLDSKDREWIAFRDMHNGSLKVAGRPGDGWTVLEVDPGTDVGSWVSAALDSDGNAAIAYHDRKNGTLNYASNQDGTLKRLVVDDGIITFENGAQHRRPVGQHCSLAFGFDGLPRIIYLDGATLDLKLVVGIKGNGFEDPQIIDDVGTIGFFSDIKLGLNQLQALSCRYSRDNQGDLVVDLAAYQFEAGISKLGGGW